MNIVVLLLFGTFGVTAGAECEVGMTSGFHVSDAARETFIVG